MISIRQALDASSPIEEITVQGWVRTRRDSKGFAFVELNDGSCLANLQIIVDHGTPGHERLHHFQTGASAEISGRLVTSPAKGQAWELHASSIHLVGASEESYPLQKKGHSPEFLRSIAHLRPRTNLFGAIFRIRSHLSLAVHQFFHDRGFCLVHTPIITTSDCEGAGELFRVTTLPAGAADRPAEDFFHRNAFLTVSGQLEAETFACALTKVYTFGPTFRAENSHTPRHASEFWMIEPEMAFCNLSGDMDLAEEFTQAMVRYALNHCQQDLAFLDRFTDKGLVARLEELASTPIQRLSYSDAIHILSSSGQNFTYPVSWGLPLQTEHERYLAETHIGGAVTVFDYPASFKPFYMRRNDDGKTVAALDLLVPGVGELIGGSQREERLFVLEQTLADQGLDPASYSWYTDLRRFGTVPHAGFGLGFERLLMLVTGSKNIRDVIPFPRTPGHADF